MKHALICICKFSVLRYNGFRYLYNKKFKQLFVYANQWKAYSLSACSVFVSLTDLWTTTIIDIISSWQEENKAEWTSKKQTSVDNVKNKTSILNRITIVFHHCVSLIEHFSRNKLRMSLMICLKYTKLSAEVLFPYLENCISDTISPVLQSTARCLL